MKRHPLIATAALVVLLIVGFVIALAAVQVAGLVYLVAQAMAVGEQQ